MTLVWSTFAEATSTTEGDTSSNITEIIEKLTQPEGTKVLKISVEDTLASTSGATGGCSHLKDFPSPTPQLVDISKCLDIPAFFSVIINTVS